MDQQTVLCILVVAFVLMFATLNQGDNKSS